MKNILKPNWSVFAKFTNFRELICFPARMKSYFLIFTVAAVIAWSAADIVPADRQAKGGAPCSKDSDCDSMFCLNGATCLPEGPNKLRMEYAMYKGMSLVSLNGCFTFRFDDDSRLVIVRNSDNSTIWSNNKPNCFRLIFQGDNNLVCYYAKGGALWGTMTHHRWPEVAIMENTGQLILYRRDEKWIEWVSGKPSTC